MSLRKYFRSVSESGFEFRRKYLGTLQLRQGLPRPVSGERFERERQFYTLLVACVRANLAPDPEVVYDIGCRNWSYAPAVAAAFPRARLVGVEVDGGRRYWNLHRRIDAAASQASELSCTGHRANVIFDDFRNLVLPASTVSSALFCFFYPFVSERPCRKWGLPVSFARFYSLLAHAQTSEARQNQVLSVHQGEWEAVLARQAYGRAGLFYQETIIKPSSFTGLWPNAYDMHVFLVTDTRLR